MRSPSLVRRGIRALALLTIAVYCVSSSVHAVLSAETAENGFVITETAITVVASDEQLSQDQKFVKQWEIQSSGASQKSAIDQLKLNVPGRVYVSYTEDESHVNAPSEALGIVRISGNSKDLINSVQVANVWNASFSSSPELQVALDNTRITEASSLLTELVVMRKSALKALNTTGTADVVVLQDVLFSYTESSQESNTAAIQTSVMKDDTAQDGSGSWVIKLTSSDFASPFVLSTFLRVSEATNFVYGGLGPEALGEGVLTRVNASGLTGTKLDELIITSSPSITLSEDRGSEIVIENGIALQENATSWTGAHINVFVLSPSHINAAQLKKKLASGDFAASSVSNYGSGNLFVAANESTLRSDSLTVTSASTGSIQIDVERLLLGYELLVSTNQSGNVTFFGKSIGSQNIEQTSESSEGRICVGTERVSSTTISWEGSNTTGASVPSTSCVKVEVPARVPARILAATSIKDNQPSPNASKTPTTSSDGVSALGHYSRTKSVVLGLLVAVLLGV